MRRVGLCVMFWGLSAAHAAFGFDGVTATADYLVDEGAARRSYLDKQIRLDYGFPSVRMFAAGFLGDYQQGGEIGVSAMDRRRSTYGVSVRRREGDRTIQPGVDLVLDHGLVFKGEVRFIAVDEPEPPLLADRLTVYGVGLDRYYGDYNYTTLMYYTDPREGGRYAVVLSNTWADKDRSVRLGVVPRSDRTVGYFAALRYHWLIVAYAYTREVDFTAWDRRVVTFGFQVPFDGRWSRPPT